MNVIDPKQQSIWNVPDRTNNLTLSRVRRLT